eukprot:gnl/TRDRNA2_/TRDRNA2_164001_c0_seq1.p1 gnl/TRDRNA2_/TRDRNA2_164001_c0~~gnl/TRDRNA2_/TRDRNA2_164001_c0_seq1.p1  ORF type:complete len:198 (+),score=38.52 gnl/TRDRNA2_/TRDRNA2_164001_c0_seq1:78-671(+)
MQMMHLFVCNLLILLACALADNHETTKYTMDGRTIILDWSKCCDCETEPVKPMGKPCEITMTTAQTLKLKYSGSAYPHNLLQLPSKSSFDTCELPTDKMAVSQDDAAPGAQEMDHDLTFTEAGTYYYACSMMCLVTTGGPSDEYCHCQTFSHKLIVTVEYADTPGDGKAPSATFGFQPSWMYTGLLMVAAIAGTTMA